MEGLVQDLSGVIQTWLCKKSVTEEDERVYVTMVLQMHLRLLTFLLAHSGTERCSAVLDRLTAFLNSLSVKKLDKCLSKVYAAVPQILQAGLYLTHYTTTTSQVGISEIFYSDYHIENH